MTNAVSSVTSAQAILIVHAATGGLVGRSWSTAQPLETDDNVVFDRTSGIDDAGHVTVVFRKNNGNRDVLHATRGTPNVASVAPTWSAPVAIDLLAGTPVSTMGSQPNYNVIVAPGGNALAYWYHNAPCTANTYSTSGSCHYYYMARYIASSNSWGAPELITDAPSPAFIATINDRGDIALMGHGWIRSGAASYATVPALFMRNATEATFRRQLLNAVPLNAWMLDLDAASNLLVAAEAKQNATTDLVAYRGTVDAGMGAQQVLDTRGASATLTAAKVGQHGQQVVVWRQNNGVATAVWAATSSAPLDLFVTQELGELPIFGETILTVADGGAAQLMNRYYGWRQGWQGGQWQSLSDLPPNSPTSAFLGCAHARNGNFLCIANNVFGESDTGRWSTYDASRNVMVQAPVTSSPSPGYVLGVNTTNRGVGYESPLLSVSGIGATNLWNKYDVLPNPASVAGDGRNVTNLWGTFLK